MSRTFTDRRDGGDGSFYSRRLGNSSPRKEEAEEPRSVGSRSGGLDEPIMGEDNNWVRKSSRQRRFTNSSLPKLHEREGQIEADFQDRERDEALGEMSEVMNDMSGFVSNFAERKEEELKLLQEMFDEEGNPIQRYDEEGNPIPFDDEDGYSMAGWERYEEDTKQANTVTIDTTQMAIKEGWLWKKGSGQGLFGRTSWAKRYFKFDMLQVVSVFYYKDPPQAIPEQRESETREVFRERRRRALTQERTFARGWVRLMYASLEVPQVRRGHRNANINPDWEFDIVIPNGRTFTLAAETEEEYEKWTKTIGFITGTLHRARESLAKKRPTRSVYDESKRDAALACTSFGKGLFESVAGQTSEFFVQGFDRETGTPATQGGLRITAVMESRDLHYDLTVRDQEDGTYVISYTPTRVGKYELSIMLDDYDIQGSPFSPVVRPAPVSAPHCVAEGAGLFCSVVGVVNKFTIHTRNSFNQIVVARGVPFEVFVSSPLVLCNSDGTVKMKGESTFPAKDNGDGSYTVSYMVEPYADLVDRLNRGEHVEAELSVTLDDRIHMPSFSRSIKGGPYHPVMAASATGAALASAARQAALTMGPVSSAQLSSLLNSFASQSQHHQQQQQQHYPASPIVMEFSAAVHNNTTTASFANAPTPDAFDTTLNFTNASTISAVPHPSIKQKTGIPARLLPERRTMDVTTPPPEYLPIRRNQGVSSSAVRTDIDSSFNRAATPSVLTSEQRNAMDAEREQLLRLRRELREGTNQVDEQVNRISILERKLQEDSQRLLSRIQPTPPPAQNDDHAESKMNESYTTRRDWIPGGGGGGGNLSNFSFSQTPTYTKPNTAFSNSPVRVPPKPAPPTPLPQSMAFDANVNALLNKHVNALKRVFRHYASRDDGADSVRVPGFIRCASDFDITPTFASRQELYDAFQLAGKGVDALDFFGFIEALGHVAINSLGKPMFSHLYSTPASRVSVLLVMWGLGDAASLDAIIQKEKYARS